MNPAIREIIRQISIKGNFQSIFHRCNLHLNLRKYYTDILEKYYILMKYYNNIPFCIYFQFGQNRNYPKTKITLFSINLTNNNYEYPIITSK